MYSKLLAAQQQEIESNENIGIQIMDKNYETLYVGPSLAQE